MHRGNSPFSTPQNHGYALHLEMPWNSMRPQFYVQRRNSQPYSDWQADDSMSPLTPNANFPPHANFFPSANVHNMQNNQAYYLQGRLNSNHLYSSWQGGYTPRHNKHVSSTELNNSWHGEFSRQNNKVTFQNRSSVAQSKNNKRKSVDIGRTPPDSKIVKHDLMPSSISSSPSLHMKLINGAKPIPHIPGLPCEKITRAVVQYYNDYHQSSEDLKHKIILSNCMFTIVKGIFPACRLFIVGSSLSGFGTRNSDMDLCLLVTQRHDIDQKYEAVHILEAIHKSLFKCTFITSSQVIKAKVPILKFRDSVREQVLAPDVSRIVAEVKAYLAEDVLSNIDCDLNINNGVGIRNTHLLKYYCLADARVAPLMLFIKFWARFHDINDAHKRTISSYSLALMLIYYLQTCHPPVLISLQKQYPERFGQKVDLRNLRLDLPLKDIKSANVDSIGQLLQGFFDFYAYRFRPTSDVISVREARALDRDLVVRSSADPGQWKFLCIEEPFDSTNTARSVFDVYIFQRICNVFRRSAEELRRSMDVASILCQPF